MPTSTGIAAAFVLATWTLWGTPLPPAVALMAINSVPAVSSAAATTGTMASLLALSDEELFARLEANAASVGSLSIGSPGSGVLFNGCALESGTLWEIARGAQSWATSETLDAIDVVVRTVHELFPDTPPLAIGDISHQAGGRLKRHESHQVGRDVDFGFYYKAGKGAWYTPGNAANLDIPRNWALVRAMLARTDVDRIFLDTRIQRVLYKHALSIGEDKAWLDRAFQFSRGARDAVIQHLPRHRTHYHVRFYNPVAQELGRRAHPMLVELQMMAPPVYTVRHLVRRGQTIGHLATRYGTSVRAIMQANGLRTTRLRAGRSYRIPVRAAAPPSQPVVVPPRLLPPVTPEAMSAVDWPSPPPPPDPPAR